MTRRTFRLYARASFWEGIARLLDAGGTLNNYNYSNSEEESDFRALQSDWDSVGADLWQAIEKYEEQDRGHMNGQEEERAGQ